MSEQAAKEAQCEAMRARDRVTATLQAQKEMKVLDGRVPHQSGGAGPNKHTAEQYTRNDVDYASVTEPPTVVDA